MESKENKRQSKDTDELSNLQDNRHLSEMHSRADSLEISDKRGNNISRTEGIADGNKDEEIEAERESTTIDVGENIHGKKVRGTDTISNGIDSQVDKKMSEDADDDEDENNKDKPDEKLDNESSTTTTTSSTTTSDDESETTSEDKAESSKEKSSSPAKEEPLMLNDPDKQKPGGLSTEAGKSDDTTDDSDIEDDLISAINYNTITSLAALKDMLQSSGEDSDGVDSFFHHYFLSHVNRLPSRNQTHSPYPWGRRLSECREEDEYEADEGKTRQSLSYSLPFHSASDRLFASDRLRSTEYAMLKRDCPSRTTAVLKSLRFSRQLDVFIMRKG